MSTCTCNIPLDSLKVESGKPLIMAVHTEMVQLSVTTGDAGDATTITTEETGWAEGPNAFPGKRWGWSFTYPISSPAVHEF